MEYLLSFVIFGLVVVGLGLGVMFGRQPIQGTCGGLNNPAGCGACGRKPGKGPDACPRKSR